MDMITKRCQNPTHYQDSPGVPVEFTAYVRGRPSIRCLSCRRAITVKAKRQTRRLASLIRDTWQAPAWLPEGSRVTWDAATAVIRLPDSAFPSLDAGFEATEDGVGTLHDLLADEPAPEDPRVLHSTFDIHLPFPGVRARFALRDARSMALPDGITLLHDGVNGSIIRVKDGADVTAIVLREAFAGNEGAVAIADWFTSDAMQDKVHTWLEALRLHAEAGLPIEGNVPVIPADDSPVN